MSAFRLLCSIALQTACWCWIIRWFLSKSYKSMSTRRLTGSTWKKQSEFVPDPTFPQIYDTPALKLHTRLLSWVIPRLTTPTPPSVGECLSRQHLLWNGSICFPEIKAALCEISQCSCEQLPLPALQGEKHKNLTKVQFGFTNSHKTNNQLIFHQKCKMFCLPL